MSRKMRRGEGAVRELDRRLRPGACVVAGSRRNAGDAADSPQRTLRRPARRASGGPVAASATDIQCSYEFVSPTRQVACGSARPPRRAATDMPADRRGDARTTSPTVGASPTGQRFDRPESRAPAQRIEGRPEAVPGGTCASSRGGRVTAGRSCATTAPLGHRAPDVAAEGRCVRWLCKRSRHLQTADPRIEARSHRAGGAVQVAHASSGLRSRSRDATVTTR